ncbi:cell wall metabolism sensor histidine kinase WalK [Bacillus megaterium]|nr:cell wall metabolism sensor histidine kinase WalK [Priestia megaterium]
MTISNEVIQAHGGKIEVNSILDEGTTCTISFIE